MTKYDIYLLWGKDCDGNILRYYGSTQNFIKRKSQHKRNYERWVKAGRPNNKIKCSSVHIIDNGDWKMEKIDEIIGDRWEAKKKEGEYQKNNDCVNVQIASRTKKEYYNDNKDKLIEYLKKYYNINKDEKIKYQKEYRLAHRDEISEKSKENYKLNKDKFLEKNKEYYYDNKDEILQQKKDYYNKNKNEILEKWKQNYNKNKDKILEKQKEKITCECGVELRKSDLARHLKTKKHINFINSNNND